MCAGPERGRAGLARKYRAKPRRCFASTQPKGGQLRACGGSGREEAGRAPRPRRPRSQGQLHSSLQTVTSSPAHPSPAPLPPPHNCLLHLSEGAAETRRRPAASGDFPRLLALGEPPRSLGRDRRTVHFVLPTTSLGSDVLLVVKGLLNPSLRLCKTLAPANAATPTPLQPHGCQ